MTSTSRPNSFISRYTDKKAKPSFDETDQAKLAEEAWREIYEQDELYYT